MYTYKFSDKQSEEIEKKAQDYGNMEKLFMEVDKKFNMTQSVNEEDYNKELELERRAAPTRNHEEVLNQAQEQLQDYKATQEQIIEDNAQLKGQKLDQDLTNLEQSTAKSQEALEGALERAKTDASNDAIKRGLARSSVIVNKLASYDQTYLKEFASIEKNFLEVQNKLNGEKSLLELQKQNALNAFDITYAAKLTEKINGINEKLLKQEKEVIEYNNKLEEIEREFELKQTEKLNKAKSDAAKQNQDYAKFIASGGRAAIENAKEQEKYDIAVEYLSGLPRVQALYELKNNSYFQYHLKTRYKALVSQMEDRTS